MDTPVMTTERKRGRHSTGRPAAELLGQAAAQNWDSSLLAVHARRHRPRIVAPVLPSRWTWEGDLLKEGEPLLSQPPSLVREYVRQQERNIHRSRTS